MGRSDVLGSNAEQSDICRKKITGRSQFAEAVLLSRDCFFVGNVPESWSVRAAGDRLKLECTFGYFLWFCGKLLTITDDCQGIVRNSKKRKKYLSVYL